MNKLNSMDHNISPEPNLSCHNRYKLKFHYLTTTYELLKNMSESKAPSCAFFFLTFLAHTSKHLVLKGSSIEYTSQFPLLANKKDINHQRWHLAGGDFVWSEEDHGTLSTWTF